MRPDYAWVLQENLRVWWVQPGSTRDYLWVVLTWPWTKCWKNQVGFYFQSTLVSRSLNIARVEKVARKACGCGQRVGSHSIRARNNVLYGWWFSSAFEIVWETLFSCDTEGLAPKRTGTLALQKEVSFFNCFLQGDLFSDILRLRNLIS